jgi:hypothetical protein
MFVSEINRLHLETKKIIEQIINTNETTVTLKLELVLPYAFETAIVDFRNYLLPNRD